MPGLGDVWDLIVKISGDGSSFRDDVKEDKAELDALFADLDDKLININLDDEDAVVKLDELIVKLEEIRNAHAGVDIDDTTAKAKIDEMIAKLKEIRDAKVKVDVDNTDVEAQVEETKAELGELPNKKTVDVQIDNTSVEAQVEETNVELGGIDNKKNVEVNIDNAELAVQAEEAHAELDAEIPDEKTVHIHVDEDKLDPSMFGDTTAGSNATKKTGRRGGILPWLIGAAVPLVSPVGAPAVAGGMGLLSSLLAGGAGTAGLAAVATPDIKSLITDQQKLKTAVDAVNAAEAKVQGAKTYQQWLTATQGLTSAQNQLEAAQDGVGSSEQKAITALNTFESFWHSFTASFKPAVFAMFTQGLSMLQSLLTDMKPVITAAASAFTQLEGEASKALGSPFWKSFFQYLGGSAKDSIVSIGQSIGNLGKGLAGLMLAFDSMAKSMNQGLVSLTAKFADWATNLSKTQGFKDFLSYAQKEGPVVMSTIGNLAKIVGQLLVDIAPVGAAFLSLINDLAKFLTHALSTNSVIGDLIAIIMRVVTNVLEFADAIVKLLNWLSKTHPVIENIIEAIGLLVAALLLPISPIILIVAGIAGLVAAGVALVNHWHQVSAWAKSIWGDIETWFKAFWSRMKPFFAKWGPDILLVIAPFIGIPLYIYQHFQQIETWLQDVWNTVKADATSLWDNIKSAISTGARNAYSAITNVFDGLGSYFSNLWNEAVTWGENLVGNIAKGIENAIGAVRNAVNSVVSAIAGPLAHHSPAAEGPLSDDDQWMPRMMQMMIDGVQQYTPRLSAAINNALSVVSVPSNVASMIQQGGAQFVQTAANTIHAGGNTFQVVIQGNVHGVDDLNAAIADGFNQHMNNFVGQLRHTSRAMGVSN